VAEVERCLAKGTKALSFVEDPYKLDLPSYHTDYWEPLMALCQEASLPLCMHLGSSGAQTHARNSGIPIVEMSCAAFLFAAVCTLNLACSPTARHFPDVKYVWSESGIGWIPAALERADRQWSRHRHWTDLDDLLPSEVVRRSFWFGTIDEPVGLTYRKDWDSDAEHILYETDYPHADTNWPNVQAASEELFDGVPDDHRRRMMYENAEKLYGWELTIPDWAPVPDGFRESAA
jgi:predicted TIM-barrel fold metal-dependent hydrolase